MPENWQRTMGPSVPNEYSSCSPDLPSFFDAGKEHRHSELRDQSYSADKQTSSYDSPDIHRMGIHAKPSEVIDGQRSDESCRYLDTHKRAGTDLIHKSETGIDLDRPYETADHSPPGHLCESLRCRQRVRHDEEGRGEKERDECKRHSRREPWISERLVELTVHGGSARLQSSSENDEWNDPASVHCVSFTRFEPTSASGWPRLARAGEPRALRLLPP